MGEIEFFLGLHIICDCSKQTISVDQTHYIQCILKHFDIQTFLPTFTPLPTDTILTVNPKKESDTSLTTHYQQVVGSLMYAMLGTRPDICFAVNHLSQYGSNPTHNHMIAAQHLLKYLAITQHHKLMYGANNSTELIGYSNSNLAGNRDDCHLTTIYTFILSGGSIAWAAQKQCAIALSLTEAEYIALTECLKHTL